jgi:sulfur-oxidizing protein SoxX
MGKGKAAPQGGSVWEAGFSRHYSSSGGLVLSRTGIWLNRAGRVCAAMVLVTVSGRADALECRPKTVGYFQQMAAFASRAPSPGELAGIAGSLTGSIGDPARGRLVMIDKEKGNCLACHRVPALSEEPAHGDLGSNLNGVGGRFSEAQLRQIIADPKVLFPNTVMPAFHIVPEFQRVPQSLAAKTVLAPGEVEDIIAFLKELR